jgi:hypothetical protein
MKREQNRKIVMSVIGDRRQMRTRGGADPKSTGYMEQS